MKLAPLVLGLTLVGLGMAAAAPPAEIVLPGGDAGIGFDDLGYSPSLGKVLAPAGRTGNLDLVDPSTHQVTVIGGFRERGSFGGGHGEGTTSVDEGGGYLFATDRTSETVNVVDPRAGKIAVSAKLAAGPDYVRYVEPTRELWVTEPDRDRIEIFRLEGSPPRPVHSAFLDVPGGPESLVVDSARGRAYTNLWKDKTLAIDLKSRSIVERWSNGCADSRGIALDRGRDFVFAACAEGKAVVLDAAHGGKILGSVTSGSGVDIIDYDPKLGHLYFPGARSETLAILAVSPEGQLSVLEIRPTAPSAHCVVSDRQGNAYVCDPKRGRLLVIRDSRPRSAP